MEIKANLKKVSEIEYLIQMQKMSKKFQIANQEQYTSSTV